MNKLIKSLTVAALAVSASAYAHTQQTYLQVRPQGVNLPLEYTTFNERMTSKLEGRFGGNFMISGWYGESSEGGDLGKYFGINDKSSFVLGTAAHVTSDDADYALYRVIQGAESTYSSKEATIKLDPKEKTWGVRFDYYQNLDKLVKGLYLKVNLPIVGVKRDMNIDITSDNSTLTTDLTNYFNGSYSKTQAGSTINAQKALEYGKIKGSKDETGVADIEVTLGYKFLYREKYHLALNLAIIIPTGNDGDCDVMFEPIYGAGQHFGFGGGLDAQARLWGDNHHNIKLNLVANYRYLFESSEHRIYRINDVKYPYINLAKVGDTAATPAPNSLRLNSDVTPGSMFDGILALAYNNGGFCFDLGYNMYYREDEDVHIKGDMETGWYVVDPAKWTDTSVAFVAATHADTTINTTGLLTNDVLDHGSAATPSQFTNSIYGGLGYTFKEWNYPWMLGIGGKYEFASKNSAIEQWQVWAKTSLSF